MPAADLFLFVSHVSEDRAAAMEIVEELERRGVKCWIAPRDVRPGQPFDDEIVDAIEASRAMLLVFSDLCNESEYIRREVTVAGESQKVIMPFRIEDAHPRRGLRVRLSDLHWIDGFVARERAIDELARHLVDPSSSPQSRPSPMREDGRRKASEPTRSPVPGVTQGVSDNDTGAGPRPTAAKRTHWRPVAALVATLAIGVGGFAVYRWHSPRVVGSAPTSISQAMQAPKPETKIAPASPPPSSPPAVAPALVPGLSGPVPAPPPAPSPTPTPTPPSPAPAPTAEDMTRTLQTELNRVGCYAGPIDGVWGQSTAAAVRLFNDQELTDLDTTAATAATIAVVKQRTVRICPLACGAGQRADGDRCVAITCSAGLVLASSGHCVRPRAPSDNFAAPAPSSAPPAADCFVFNGQRRCD